MSLTVVATPIGNIGDITLRAVESLKKADIIICEELKPARVLLKRTGVGDKELYQLNEHSRPADVAELVGLCRDKDVCLISDCGTPGFCDPGAALVDACAREGIAVDVNPGPSSLMALLSMAGVQIKEFYFVGFLPAEKGARQKRLSQLKTLKSPLIIMDTPYRLQATLEGLALEFPEAQAVLGVDLTGEGHQVARGALKSLASKPWAKAPFVLLIQPR